MKWREWMQAQMRKPLSQRSEWFKAGYISEEAAARAVRRGYRYLRSHAGRRVRTAPRHIHEKLRLGQTIVKD